MKKKIITCLTFYGRFPWPAGRSCLALPSKTCFEEMPLQCCHDNFEVIGLVVLPMFVTVFWQLERSSALNC